MLTHSCLCGRPALVVSIPLAAAMLVQAGCGTPASSSGGGGAEAGAGPRDATYSLTLEPAEAQRVGFEGRQGETWVCHAAVESAEHAVDVNVYDEASRSVASASGNPGRPANVWLTLDQDGPYFVEVANRSGEVPVSCGLSMQSLPSPAAATSTLNGLYRIVEFAGERVSPSVQEKLLFANGSLVSRYVQMDAEVLGLPEDLEVWVNHRTGAVTEAHYAESDITVQATRTTTRVDGLSVHFELAARTTVAGQAVSLTLGGESIFDGQISHDGSTLTGVIQSRVYFDEQLGVSFQVPIVLELE